MKRIIPLALIGMMGGSVQATAAEIIFKTYCPMAHVTGIGRGATTHEAREAAIKDCISKGGRPDCCDQFTRQIQ